MNAISNISGLRYIPNFISADKSAELLERIDKQDWRADLRRRVQHYGYIYDYRSRAISHDMKLGPLPNWLSAVSSKLVEQKIFAQMPDQVIINEYEPGQGIAAHIDCVPCFGDHIASLSLGGAVDMRLDKGGEAHNLRLMPQSLLALSGEARLNWRHGIAARKSDLVESLRVPRSRRVSLTFRTIKLIE